MDMDIEERARQEIVSIAKKNGLYFVIWNGHTSRQLVAIENKSRKEPNIYGVMYEAYYDVVNKDPEKFCIKIQNKISWIDALTLIKANLPVHHYR